MIEKITDISYFRKKFHQLDDWHWLAKAAVIGWVKTANEQGFDAISRLKVTCFT